MTLPTIIFDVDDVLNDFATGLHAAIVERITAAEKKIIAKYPDLTVKPETDAHGHITNWPLYMKLIGEYNPEVLREYVAFVYDADALKEFYDKLKPDPKFNAALQGYKKSQGGLAIISNGIYDPHIQRVLERMGLTELFPRDKIIDGTDCKAAWKPDPKGYEAGCAILGVSPDKTIFIDDSLSNILGAQQAGAYGIWFNTRHSTIAQGNNLPNAEYSAKDSRETDGKPSTEYLTEIIDAIRTGTFCPFLPLAEPSTNHKCNKHCA